MQTKDTRQSLCKLWDALQLSLSSPRWGRQFLKDPLNKFSSSQYSFIKRPTLSAPTEICQRLPSPAYTSTKPSTLQVWTPPLTDSHSKKDAIATAGFSQCLSKLTEDKIYGLPRSWNLTH
jgi:hypothetical protein